MSDTQKPEALSKRIRPDVEAAPWVCEAVKALEAENEALRADAERYRSVLDAFNEYVTNEQMSTDGAVQYSTTAINHWAFLARAAMKENP